MIWLLGILAIVVSTALTYVISKGHYLRWLSFFAVLPLVLIVFIVGAFVVDDARLVGLHRLHYSMIRKGATQVQVERVMGPPYSDMHDGSGRVYHNWSLTHWDWGERDPAHNVKWYVEVEFDGEGRVVHKEGSFCTFD